MSDLKRKVGAAAAEMVRDGQRLGLGTGSTVFFFLQRLAERIRDEGLSVTGIPTSVQTSEQARELGIPLITFKDAGTLDFYVDGADEIDLDLNMIKGGGGALLREKVVASASDRKVIIVDGSKVVERLGLGFDLPVEVVPFGWQPCRERLLRLGCEPALRKAGEELFVTNNGNYILDCAFAEGIADPAAVEASMNRIPGVVCNGLFIGLADEALVGRDTGVETLRRR
jgi:ribose 5-phosphate isomerase A